MRSVQLTVYCCVVILATGLFTSCPEVTASEREVGKSPVFQVYAFCHDTHDANKRDHSQQAAMLKQLGYDGVGHVGLDDIEQRLQSLDEAGLKLYLAGVTINVKQDVAQQLRPLDDVLPLLKGRKMVIYVVVTGLPPGDPEGMDRAVAAVRKLSERIESADVQVGIYPHTGDWVATVPQAVALVKNVDRKNCGVIFNLCHFLRNERVESLDDVLGQAAQHLVGVTINGADLAGRGDKDWRRLIQPLDRGTFDLAALVKKLAQLNYSGPVGIMCYGIGGDAQTHLARSLKAWREL